MVLTSRFIKTLNIIFIGTSVFALIKTSSIPFLLIIEEISILKSAFTKLTYGNTEIASLSASVLAAYIFYFVNNYLPEIKRKKEHIAYLSPRIIKVIDSTVSVFRLVNEHSNSYIDFPLKNFSQIKKAAKKIKFGSIYEGSSTLEIHDGKHKVVNREIEYHVAKATIECLKNISQLRLTNTILDNKLLSKLDSLERSLNQAIEILGFMSSVDKKTDDFDQAIMMYEGVYEAAKDLMLYYRKNIDNSAVDCDIWFNSKARNFERLQQKTH